MHNNTKQSQITVTQPAPYKPYGHRKDESASLIMCMQPKKKIIHHDVPLRPWEAVGAGLFHFNNINYLCVVDYNSNFPIVRKLQGLSA